MKDTLSYLVRAIVDDPESVQIDETEDDGVVNLIITVSKDDMGRVIGKEGKVIRSIRNIMKVKAIKENKRISVSLAENQ